jgi:Ca2+-binding RTX toxin-like protein
VLTDDAGNDTLNGGMGADTMTGGLGDDTYVVDNPLDLVMEDAMEGTDRVLSSVTHTLAANVENLTLTGSGAINGTGNGLGNVIAGNIGANLLAGMDGNDTMLGGAGNDTVNGGTGMDLLTGGQGTDTLTGGADSDRFDFNNLDGSVDTITDFNSAAPGLGGDVLDLADLLIGFDPMASMIDAFVRYTQQGNDTRVQVNADGAGMDFVDVAILQGVMGVSASQALANGNLDVTPDV